MTGAGGGGAGLGGAIFSDNGLVTVRNSTFTGNWVVRGVAGIGGRTDSDGPSNGSDAGAAVFSVDGVTYLTGVTVAYNESTGSGAGVVMYRSTRSGYTASLGVVNSLIAWNDVTPGVDECYTLGAVSSWGSGNLMTNNGNCHGVESTEDPLLATSLAIELPGLTPTLAIGPSSPAYDFGDGTICEWVDQRGVPRPQYLNCDIGAYEYQERSADLAASTAVVGTAVAGQDVSFIVGVSNRGPTEATSVTLIDTLPAGTIFVSLGVTGMSCSGTGPVTCTTSELLSGASRSLTLTVRIPADVPAGTSLANAVAVSSATPDPDSQNDSASSTFAVVTRADLSATASGPTEPVAGTSLSYTLGIANAGPSNAASPVLASAVPSAGRFTSLTAPTGWSCTTPAVGAAGSISCSRSTLAPAGSASFTLVMGLPASATDGSQLCVASTASSSTTDPDSSDDSAQSCANVITRADLAVSQTATTSGKPGKGSATFRVTVTNNGPSDSQQVVMQASSSLFVGPPPSLASTAGGTCTISGQTVSCTWTTIAAGAAPVVTITVPWRSAVGQVCVTDGVSAATTDPVATNDTGGVCAAKR